MAVTSSELVLRASRSAVQGFVVRLSAHRVNACQVAPRVDSELLAPTRAAAAAGLRRGYSIQTVVGERLCASRIQAVRNGLDIAVVGGSRCKVVAAAHDRGWNAGTDGSGTILPTPPLAARIPPSTTPIPQLNSPPSL